MELLVFHAIDCLLRLKTFSKMSKSRSNKRFFFLLKVGKRGVN